MFRKTVILFSILLLALAIPFAAFAQHKTFYWISHGSPADPVWTYFLEGAKQWAKDTGNTVNTSGNHHTIPISKSPYSSRTTAADSGPRVIRPSVFRHVVSSTVRYREGEPLPSSLTDTVAGFFPS